LYFNYYDVRIFAKYRDKIIIKDKDVTIRDILMIENEKNEKYTIIK